MGCVSFHQGALPGQPQGLQFVQVEGARVRFVDSQEKPGPSDKPTVVLVHGFAASSNTWAGVKPVLENKGYRVVAMDLKGFGWTDRPQGDYSPQAQAKLILALLDKRGVKNFALVGHSWGSSVSLALALLAPKRVQRIALYDAWVYEAQLPTFFLWSRTAALGEVLFWLFYKEQPGLKITSAFYDKRYVTQPLVDDVRAQLERPGTSAAALAAVRGQRFELYESQYAQIKQPVLLLWGREDAVAPLWVGERLVRQLPSAKLVIYPKCGHFPMIEAYGASTRDLSAFLAPMLNRNVFTPKPKAQPEPTTTPQSQVTP